jgi:type IV pilus assembly protein PilW
MIRSIGAFGSSLICSHNVHRTPRASQMGLTMVEMLVALVISLLIALAAISALIVSRQGFTTVDVSSQLRDNGRFASDLIQRIGAQTGYKNDYFVSTNTKQAVIDGIDPNVFGFNNALVNVSGSSTTISSTARTTADGSDVLVLRYQASTAATTSGAPDGSMINCAGFTGSTTAPMSLGERMVSIFHVKADSTTGEPSLYCSHLKNDGTGFSTQPLIQGVENFQVLYGTDDVTPNTAPPASAASDASDSTPDRYLRADQLTVAGNTTATRNNWRRVRSVRIGLVLRGTPNSQQGSGPATFYPFGAGKASASSAVGTAFSSSADVGTVFTPVADGRMRVVSTFTVHLRNNQLF